MKYARVAVDHVKEFSIYFLITALVVCVQRYFSSNPAFTLSAVGALIVSVTVTVYFGTGRITDRVDLQELNIDGTCADRALIYTLNFVISQLGFAAFVIGLWLGSDIVFEAIATYVVVFFIRIPAMMLLAPKFLFKHRFKDVSNVEQKRVVKNYAKNEDL